MADPANQANQGHLFFALTPGLIQDDVLDYRDPNERKVYKDAIVPIDPVFDLDPTHLKNFLEKMSQKVRNFNWFNICKIRVGNATKDLIRDYGQITINDINVTARDWLGQPTRDAQNSQMMYDCLAASLTTTAFNKVSTIAHQYTFVINDQVHKDGPSFLKSIIMKTQIDTRVTTSLVRANLSSLDAYLPTINYDIEAFNEYVTDQRDLLIARAEDTTDLMVNLFKGYMVAQDAEFVKFIKDEKNKYEIQGVDMDPEQLMKLAEIKYKALKQSKQWNAPTPEQQEIVALKAQLADYKKGALQLSRHLQKQRGGAGNPKNRHQRQGPGKTGEPNKGAGNGNQPWWKVPPKPGESCKKEYKEKIYYWCARHKKWVRHPTNKCRLPKDSGQSEKDKNKDKSTQGDKQDAPKKVSFSTTIRNMIEEVEEEEFDEQAST